ncbi:MAG: DUF1570 domain-containing protein [Planctomycetota bacterium]
MARFLLAVLLIASAGLARQCRVTAEERPTEQPRPSSLVLMQDRDEDSEDGKKKREKKKKKIPPPPAENLILPETLTETQAKELREGIAAFERAKKALQASHLLKRAVRELDEARRKAPKSPLPVYYLGIAHQYRMDFKKARKALEKSIKLAPDFYEAHVELGDVCVWERDLEGAIPHYDRALDTYAYYHYGLQRKATVLIQLGRFQEASPILDRAMEVEKTEDLGRLRKMLDDVINGYSWSETYVSETQNYRIKTPVSQEFADEISKRAELIRRLYDRAFPDIRKPDRKYEIVVHASKGDYHDAGGPPMAGGHYDPFFRRLVLFRYDDIDDTLLVLNHEGFHQYLADYLPRAPQWFNEGLADFFGPSEYIRQGGKDRMRIRPNPWRLDAIKQLIRHNRCPPATELMTMTQQEMYDPKMAGIHYAQAWAIVHYCMEGQRYRKTLQSYFKQLRKGKGLDEAFRRTFGRLDMERFERDWRNHISGL